MQKIFTSVALAVSLSIGASAQSNAPVIKLLPSEYTQISDNGKWAVAQKGSEVDGDLTFSGGTIIEIATGAELDVSHSSGASGLADITDDGGIAVGECTRKPAYWSRATGQWTILDIPDGYVSGRLNSVTPDGRYAAGYIVPSTFNWGSYPIMYDLTTNQRIELPNLPKLDMTHLDQLQNCIYGMSADGRYLLGQMSESYILPPSLCSYVYDRQTATYKMIGFTENALNSWKPKWDNLFFVEGPRMSSNGKYVTGHAYMVEPIAGSEFGNEYRAAFLYNVETDEFTVYNKAGENDISGAMVLDDGTVIGATPAVSPYASSMVRSGKYYISLDQIFKQVYGIDINSRINQENTGFPYSISADGLVWLMGYAPEKTYMMTLSEPITEAAKRVNLLGNYTVSPVSGTVMSRLTEVRLTFDREVETNGVYTKITCKSDDGSETFQPLQSNGWKADGKNVIVTFRTRTMRKGVKYTLNIPAGMIRMAGDPEVTSAEINVTFTGRGDQPVSLTEAYPADGASVASLDLTNNPMLLTFDASIKLTGDGQTKTNLAYLYRVGEDAPYCNLNILGARNQLLIYPTSGQHLFNGTDYKVVIPAGTVTDLSGAGENQEIVLNYKGSYVRTISADDKILFSSPCDDLNDFIFYDGDRLNPGEVPSSWGFTQYVPWFPVRSTADTRDWCLAAHSMFASSGTSDDWMSIPQLYIPDQDCYLQFDAQSYMKSKNDVLKVYVYASNNVYDTFNSTIARTIRENGDLVFDQKLSPGASEEDLEGDWQKVNISLAKYAGKDVYICFVNANTDGSAIFLDNVQVIHDMRFLASFQTPARVVAKESVAIKGTVSVATDQETFSSIAMTLKDAEGKVLDNISQSGLSLTAGSVYDFAFAKELPLAPGTINKFSVDITLGDRTTTVDGEVRNLTFEPFKRIVLEEFSGAECSNCPLGFAALSNLERLYPQNILPIILRTYSADPLTSGMGAYTSFLNFTGAPSATINRSEPIAPMVSADGDYRLSGAGLKDSSTGEDLVTWQDVFSKEVAEPADAEINFSSSYADGDAVIKVDFGVRTPLNLDNVAYNVFAVITEDKLITYQTSNVYNVADEDLGEWGKGGMYAAGMIYPFELSHVARHAHGTTFNGTGGLIPATLEAGKEYKNSLSITFPTTVEKPENCQLTLMLIDAATGKVINANRAPINGSTSGVDDIVAGFGKAPVIKTVNGDVEVSADGSALRVAVYAVDGTMLGSANGNDTVTVAMNGYTGVAIVKAVAGNGASATAKVILK